MEGTHFRQILDSVSGKNGTYTASVDASWQQGRAIFGGIMAAIGIRAAKLELNDPSPLRSLLLSFVGPLSPGDCDIIVHLLRVGSSVSHCRVEINQNGECACQLLLAFGVSRDTIALAPEPHPGLPDHSAWPTLAELNMNMYSFLNKYDIKFTGTGVPASGTKDRDEHIWARFKDDMTGIAAEAIASIADIPPPVMMSHYTVPITASSLTWKLEFVMPPEEGVADWYYLHYTADAARDGYSQQAGKVYDENGRLIAVGHQCMVYFEPKS